MAHYALIENDRVVNVIVADEEFIRTLSGEWVQTSYNTRGGVHYDPNTGLPDGGVALRLNYAWVGAVYDREHDAFVAEKPYANWVLDISKGEWVPPVPLPEPLDPELDYIWIQDQGIWVTAEKVLPPVVESSVKSSVVAVPETVDSEVVPEPVDLVSFLDSLANSENVITVLEPISAEQLVAQLLGRSTVVSTSGV